MADIDDEGSSGGEERSQDEGEEGFGEEGDVNAENFEEEFADGNALQGTIPENWSPFVEMPQSPDLPVSMPKFNLFPDNWADVPEDQDQKWMCFCLLLIGVLMFWNAVLWESYS